MRRGFTMIEMLVVMLIIGIVAGIAFPVLSSMQSGSKMSAGVNTVSVAVSAARSYVDRERTHNTDPLVAEATVPASPFKGIAALFTPSGEIRLLGFDPQAHSTGGDLLANSSRAGFVDIPSRSYIDIPSGVVIRGLIRDGSGAADLRAIEPPFALRFNEFGQLISGQSEAWTGTDDEDDRVVYYNSDNSANGIAIGRHRGAASYNYAAYVDSLDSHWNSTLQKHDFPVEEIDAVIGVRVIHEDWFDAGEPSGVATNAPSDAVTDLMFSRSTGAPMRNQ